MSEVFPPIEELLLHRGSMLLLDRVLRFDSAVTVVEYTPRMGAWYVQADGQVPAWIGIELMAQAVAVHVAMTRRKQQVPAQLGLLLGTRRYTAYRPIFAIGEALRVDAQELFRGQSGLGAYECGIVATGSLVAEATLKVYEPADPQQWIQTQEEK